LLDLRLDRTNLLQELLLPIPAAAKLFVLRRSCASSASISSKRFRVATVASMAEEGIVNTSGAEDVSPGVNGA
jgi:hypothetical protein